MAWRPTAGGGGKLNMTKMTKAGPYRGGLCEFGHRVPGPVPRPVPNSFTGWGGREIDPSAGPGPAGPGPARLGSAQLRWGRLGLAQLNSAGLGHSAADCIGGAVALAIGGGWLVTPGVVDPAAAPRLAG